MINRASPPHPSALDLLDRLAIADLVVRERTARDGLRWAEMAACYHPESTVDISWFKGSAAEFVQATEQMASGGLYTFHEMGASDVTLRGHRALVDSNCSVQFFSVLDGAEVNIVSHCRLKWRVQRSAGCWLIAGLRSVYLRDVLLPVNPLQLPELDLPLLASLRPSYRHIAYRALREGRHLPGDLAGADMPTTVAALEAAEQQWLLAKH